MRKDHIVDFIKYAVFQEYGISIEDMEGKSRDPEIVHARHVAIYLAKLLTDMSLKKIGFKFGNRNHTVMIYAVRRIDDYISPNHRGLVSDEGKRVQKLFNELSESLKVEA